MRRFRKSRREKPYGCDRRDLAKPAKKTIKIPERIAYNKFFVINLNSF